MTHVLVVGGGFAGFWAALAARRAGGQLGVTLLSRDPLLQMRPRLYEGEPQTLGVDVLPLLAAAGVEFVAGEAVGLDPRARTVALSSGALLGYDRLVIATGSVMRRPDLPGASAAYSIDTLADAMEFDRRLATIATSVAAPVVAIVGAGFTGIELALEMRDRLALHGGPGVAEQARIILIDRATVVGPELGAGPRPYIEAALAEAKIELRLGAGLRSLQADAVSFGEGFAIQPDAVVLATGMRAADFVAKVPGEFDALGRLMVEPTLRAPAAPEIFVAGDAACADVGDGRRALQSCQHALRLGRFAGENAARDLISMPLLSYRQPRYVTCLDLGRAGAVLTEGWDRRVVKTGGEAKAVKRRINTQAIYPPTAPDRDTLLAASGIV